MKQVTIQGPAASVGTLEIQRDTTMPAFRIFTTGLRDVTINDLLIAYGSDPLGGGIYSQGNLNLNRDTFLENTADNGGAIAAGSTTSQLILHNVDIHYNTATGLGGGIYNRGALDIFDSSIYSNRASAGTGSGGGIFNSASGSLNLTATDIYSNTAGLLGGGIYNYGNLSWDGGRLYANSTGGSGGGLCEDSTATITIQNVNISSNQALNGGGGGIYLVQGTVFLDTCFLGGNKAKPGLGDGVAYKAGTNFVPQNCTLNDAIVQV